MLDQPTPLIHKVLCDRWLKGCTQGSLRNQKNRTHRFFQPPQQAHYDSFWLYIARE